MVKENHYKKWCQNSCVWEKTDNSSVPLGFSPLQYMTLKIYMQPLQYHEKDMTQTYAKVAVCTKKRQTQWVSASMESRHVGWIDSSVYGFCFCTASLPHHNLTSWPLWRTVYHREPNCAGSDSTETSRTWQPIPYECMQKVEFVVPLCNAMTAFTWKTDWC